VVVRIRRVARGGAIQNPFDRASAPLCLVARRCGSFAVFRRLAIGATHPAQAQKPWCAFRVAAAPARDRRFTGIGARSGAVQRGDVARVIGRAACLWDRGAGIGGVEALGCSRFFFFGSPSSVSPTAHPTIGTRMQAPSATVRALTDTPCRRAHTRSGYRSNRPNCRSRRARLA
jgi:hypothetical protein